MKKKLIGITALAAALTLSTGMTAFAGWVQDSHGWAYQNDNGTWRGAGWFKDPVDGAEYYFDPDGYMMTDTRVEGYKLGPDGRKQEKTEEDLRYEEARKQRIASRPSPAKSQAAADLAASAAKSATTAVTTTRLSYQAEMKVFMDSIFIDTIKTLRTNEGNTIQGDTTENNLETTYRFNSADRRNIITCSLGKVSNVKSTNYTAHSLELSFTRNILSEENEVNIFNDMYSRLLVASLGENEGKAVYDRIYAETAGNGAEFNRSGNTDTGNFYELTYKNDTVDIKVTCSEIDPNAQEEEPAQAEEQEAAPVEETVTSTVIVAGAGQSVSSEETAEETSTEETSAEETPVEESAEDSSAAE